MFLAAHMTLLRIHHAAIIASNYETSKHFYTHILGLRILAEHHRPARQSTKLDLALPDGGQIELFSFPSTPPRPSHPEACGLRHLAFAVNHLEEWQARLHSFSIETEPIRVDEYTTQRFFFFSDPDGLPLEFYEVCE